MIVYEVNLTINQDVASDYREWLEGHIEQILKQDGFHSAKLYERESDEAGGGECWTVHYYLENRQSLNDYLDNQAEAFRADAVARFGGSFSAARRVLDPIQKFVKTDA